jgi:LacI family transcriptional regulator
MRSLARQLGISAATVSLALRDSARIGPVTKQRIVRAARRAGYRNNPLVGSLMAALRRTSHAGFQGSLIAVNASPDVQPRLTLYHRQVFDGAQRRAGELGFSLGLCWVGQHALTMPRLDLVLRARNVPGVIVMPLVETRDFSHLDWTRVAATMLDHCLLEPSLHTVLPDHQLSMLSVLEHLVKVGYQRPGLVVTWPRDARVKHKWSAGFSSFCQGHRVTSAVPILSEHTITRDVFLRWFNAHQPDVILGHLQSEISGWLSDVGRRIPRDVGFVQLNWTERAAPCAGLDLQPALLGAAAVESVVAQLQRNECGIPANPKTIMITARWVDGPTIVKAR